VGVVNLPCKIFGDKIEMYGMENTVVYDGDVLKLDELPIEISRSLHFSSEARVLTHGRNLPLLNIPELVNKFEKLMLSAKEILSRNLGQDYEQAESIFGSIVVILLKNIANPLETLKTFLLDNEEHIRITKESLNKIRNGDLSELYNQLNAFYLLFNEMNFESLMDISIKEEHKEEVKARLQNLYRELHLLLQLLRL